MNKKFLEFFGWYGAIAIISAYGLNSFNFISSVSFIYQFLNLTGALGIVLVSLSKKNYQPAILNIIWVVVAFISIVFILF